MLSFGSLRGSSAGLLPNIAPPSIAKASPPPRQRAPPLLLECGYHDVQQVQLIAQALLHGLAAACVERTAGDPFNQPASVLEDVRQEMLEHVQQQVDAFATRGSGSQAPSSVKVVQDILDGFVKSKRNLFRRVSSKILSSEKQDDKIEEFVQDIHRSDAWMIGRREVLAKAYLKRVDRSKMHHCVMKFESDEELADHKSRCPLRPLLCRNEGCGEVFSALHLRTHDEACLFKLLPCQQKCKATVLRGEMSKHCMTFCPMKLVDCPFHEVGCITTLPQGVVEQHCLDLMGTHLLFLLQAQQKQEISVSSQVQRILVLEKALPIAQRSEPVDIGSLSLKVREQEDKIKLLEQEVGKLYHDLKSIDVSAEIMQLRRELRNLHKQMQK